VIFHPKFSKQEAVNVMKFVKPRNAYGLTRGIEKLIMDTGIIIGRDDDDGDLERLNPANAGKNMWDKLLKGLLNRQSFENRLYKENLKRTLIQHQKEMIQKRKDKKLRSMSMRSKWNDEMAP
jgi:hypothetical protein